MTQAIQAQATDAVVPAYADDDALVAAFLAELDASARTRDSYRKAVKQYRIWLAERDMGLLSVDAAGVLEYKRGMMAQGRKPSTVNAYMAAVRAFYRWTERRRIYPNVASGIKGERISRGGAKDSLTLEQARRLLSPTGEAEGERDARDRAMVALMALRGLRTCEVARADVGDVRTVNGRAVLYVQGKGRGDKGEFVVLSEDLLDLLMAYLSHRGKPADNEPLFTGVSNHGRGSRMTTRSVSRVAKSAMAAAGIDSPRITAHSLRHTAVTFALLGGATVQEAQAMARHSNINTTLIYAHNIDRAEGRAEGAVDALVRGAA